MRGLIWFPAAALALLAVPIPCAAESAEESFAAMEKALASPGQIAWETVGEMSDNGVREATFTFRAFFGTGGRCRVEKELTALDASGAAQGTMTNLLVCDGHRVFVENAGKIEPARKVAPDYAQSILAVFARAGWPLSRGAAFDRGGPENFGLPKDLALADSKVEGRVSLTYSYLFRPGNGSEGDIQQELVIDASSSLPVERRTDLEGMITSESYRGYSTDGDMDPALFVLGDDGRPELGFGERGASAGPSVPPGGEAGLSGAKACVETMFAACKAGDAALLATCFASNCQKDFSEMLADPKQTAAFMEELADGKVAGEPAAEGDGASVHVVWTRKGKEHKETIHCVREDGQWKVIDF